MTFGLDPNADVTRILMFQVYLLMSARSFVVLGFAHQAHEVRLHMFDPRRPAPCPQVLLILRHAFLAAAASHAQVQKPCCDDLENRQHSLVLVEMRPNDLLHVPVVLASMPMTTICARRMVMCTVPQRWAVEPVGVGLGPSAFWGSWRTLSQTREMSHVDGTGR